ncbi:MAG: hypothetical protein AAB014_05470 [Nitrospirota bacterium]
MRLHFDSNQEYQIEVIRAITDLFEGQSFGITISKCPASTSSLWARSSILFSVWAGRKLIAFVKLYVVKSEIIISDDWMSS